VSAGMTLVEAEKRLIEEKTAVAADRAINNNEAVLRKVAGCAIGLVSMWAFHRSLIEYAAFGTLMNASVGVFNTGVRFVSGCIVNGFWNIDGKGIQAIPEQYNDFALAKSRQLFYDGLEEVCSLILISCTNFSFSLFFFAMAVRLATFAQAEWRCLDWIVSCFCAFLCLSVLFFWDYRLFAGSWRLEVMAIVINVVISWLLLTGVRHMRHLALTCSRKVKATE